ncbi:MAG: hypothetical protein ACR2JS_08340 [Candidatus Nanopelagicales bacterium]
MRTWTTGIIAGIGLSLLALPATSAQADDADVATSAARESVTVTVPIRTINTPDHNGQNGILEIRVGNAAPISVMVDTGIIGLLLFEKPTSARATGNRTVTTIGSEKLPGALFTAPVTVGGVTTASPVAIQYADTASPYIKQWTNRGISGIIGLGTGDGGRMTNILKSMPGSLGLRWSIHFDRTATSRSSRQGALILGAEPPVDVKMHFQLPYIGVDINGAREWNDHAAPGCWTFGTLPEQCVPTWIDSGFSVMRVKGRNFSRVPQTATHQLRPGTRVRLAADTSAFYGHDFIAGNQDSRNFARVITTGSPAVNTGNSFYFDYTVTYDLALGTISLSNTKGN